MIKGVFLILVGLFAFVSGAACGIRGFRRPTLTGALLFLLGLCGIAAFWWLILHGIALIRLN